MIRSRTSPYSVSRTGNADVSSKRAYSKQHDATLSKFSGRRINPIATATIPPRRSARVLRPYRVSFLLSVSALLGLVALTGCGGGGGGNPGNPGNPGSSKSEINGTVTDMNSAPLVGAVVQFGSQTAASTQYGSYIIPNIVIPAGRTSLVGTVVATATVKGVPYSGQNQVELLSSDPITHDVHIVMSPTNRQGSIIGVVLDSNGNRVAGARVFANVGPFSATATPDQKFFNNLASFKTTTRSDGSFSLLSLPPDSPYTVSASLAGFINQTINSISVLASSSTSVTLTLTKATGPSTVSPPPTLSATTITAPIISTRSAGSNSAGFMNVVRQILLQKRGFLAHRAASAQKVTLHRTLTRDTPSGSLIETDLFWDYQPLDNLYGYDILRATQINPNPNFTSIATLRDPLADRFADNDPILTPDLPYYYSVARLDTINFPFHPDSGVSAAAQPVTVQPLGPESLVSPASGSVTSSKPTFVWNSVNRATLYKVLVYDQFPTLQTDTDPNGVPALWKPDFSTTSAVYAGPTLISGHTYYWAVIAQDAVGSAASVSPLQTFTAP